jgi:putative membrane protein insertion efficiency factor
MKQAFIFLISAVSCFFRCMSPRACRFHPSCSAYAVQAFEEYPFWRALRLSVKRVSRCHPYSPGGFDPIPGTPA